MDLAKAKEKYRKGLMSEDEFLFEIKSSLFYYYGSKCEHEVIITSWPPSRPGSFEDRKVDVYEQVEMNWDKFTKYILDNLCEIPSVKKLKEGGCY